jgi:hypothetical protein
MGMSLVRWVTGATLGALAIGCGGAASEPDAAGEPELDRDDWTSEWRRLALPDPRLSELGIARTPGGWLLVSSAGGASSSYMYRSSDGVRWTRVHLPDDGGRLTGVAYGRGRYVVVGHSQDSSFHEFRSVLFAEDHFYVARLRSPDGQNWEEIAGPGPTSYLSGRFLRREVTTTPDAGTLEAWSEGGTPQPIHVLPAPEVELPSEGNIPESLDYSWSDGLDCTSARCVLLGRELYLIP